MYFKSPKCNFRWSSSFMCFPVAAGRLFCLSVLTVIQHPLLCNCWIQIFIIWTCWSYDITRHCWAWQAFGEACKPFCHGRLLLVPNRKWDVMWLMRGFTWYLFLLCVPGDNGLSEDLQGGQTPETVSEGSGVQLSHSKEEQPDERHR